MPRNATHKAPVYRSKMRDDAAFDVLPRALRDGLNYAHFDWSAAWVHKEYFKRGRSIESLLRAISQGDTSVVEKTRVATWGGSADELGL